MYFDSHAHLTEDCFAQDFDSIVENMKAASVTGMMEIGFDLPSSEKAVQLAERFSWVHAAVGSHPDDAAQVDEARIAVYRELCKNPRVKAIGEIGLDYAGTVGREAQLRIFREQLDWAERLGKPVVLHCVKAFEAVMRELAPHALRAVIFHGFIGSSQQAAEAIKKGYYLSFGERTFRSPRTVEALRRTPVENLFAETDESDVPIEEIYRRIAQAKDLDPELLKCAIYRNYREIFER